MSRVRGFLWSGGIAAFVGLGGCGSESDEFSSAQNGGATGEATGGASNATGGSDASGGSSQASGGVSTPTTGGTVSAGGEDALGGAGGVLVLDPGDGGASGAPSTGCNALCECVAEQPDPPEPRDCADVCALFVEDVDPQDLCETFAAEIEAYTPCSEHCAEL